MLKVDPEGLMGERKRSVRKILSLKDHPTPFVTISELAQYWLVSRKQIYKQIDAGTLRAIRLGPRLLRVSKRDALEFEETAKMMPASADPPAPAIRPPAPAFGDRTQAADRSRRKRTNG